MEKNLDKKEGLEKRTDGCFKVECAAGERCSFCTCGASKNLPFCDNSHREVNADLGTDYKSLKIMSENKTTMYVICSGWKKK